MKLNFKKYLFILGILSLFSFPIDFLLAKNDSDIQAEINKLNSEVKDKTEVVNKLKEQIRIYEENIRTKREEKLDLQNQISILENNISKTEAEITQSEVEISRLDSELKITRTKISETEDNIDSKKQQISHLLLSVYESEQKSNLEIFLSNSTLSDYFKKIEYSRRLQEDFQKTVEQMQTLKEKLKDQKKELDANKKEQETKKEILDIQNDSLKGEKIYKNDILAETEGDEAKFQEIVKKVKAEQDAANSQIAAMENQMQSKIAQLESQSGISNDPGPFTMPTDFDPNWPVTSRRITATFHDPDYPFWFEHNAIDIGASQGSPVYAADSGIVAIARHDGTTAYSFIMIYHADGFATVYGHMSAVYVAPDQKVTKGEQIGLSGGMPGTVGSGAYTTGPHLHFEVRKDGIPVDPLIYL